ncbi:tRNA dimethylallyltransferase [Candidatus Peribacteria bacterium]|nr:tRNA dimethylallyltransferase [Candidatus Peribacteria bacterium]
MISDHLKDAEHPLIVILGPTASGKTGFSIEVAKWLQNADIINADSRQLYRGMDIGTAKITLEQMQGIPHHLLDVLDPREQSTAGGYKKAAEAIIDEIIEQEKVPVLVGGSMLYIAAITDGLSFDPSKRDELRSPESKCKYDLLIIGLGKKRDEVVEKINNRTSLLFDAGWVDEVKTLLTQGYTTSDPGFVACGYREIAQYLQDGGDLAVLQEDIAAKTRQYARRQMTWWRGDTRINWL